MLILLVSLSWRLTCLGLKCHSAPFSWKLLFEAEQQLYELILCACTAREEEQWKADLIKHSGSKNRPNADEYSVPAFDSSMLSLDIKPLGSVFGQPGTFMHRSTIQRAATLNARNSGRQIIIKNTNSLKDGEDPSMSSSGPMNRSQSLPSISTIPVLAPKRAERQAIEHSMTCVWTRNRLPYPGMNANRGGHLIRTSANSVMRKLSRASMTSNSTRRVITYTSIAEGNPFSSHAKDQRMIQTDGASSFPYDDYPFPIANSEHDALAGLQWCEFSPRNSMRDNLKLVDSSGKRKARKLSEMSTLIASHEPKEIEQGPKTCHKRNTLLKAFSTEGIKAWFT